MSTEWNLGSYFNSRIPKFLEKDVQKAEFSANSEFFQDFH